MNHETTAHPPRSYNSSCDNQERHTTSNPTPTDWPALVVAALEDPLFTLDHTWRFTYFNPQALKILGQTQAALLGNVIWELFPGSLESRLGQGCRQAIADGLPQQLEDTFLGTQARYAISVRPISEGLIVMFQAIAGGQPAETILPQPAEHTRLQQEIWRAQRHLAELVTLSAEAIISLDEHQQMCLFNPAAEQMFGYAAADMLGRPVSLLIRERLPELPRQKADAGSTMGRTPSTLKLGPVSGRRRDGTEFQLEGSIVQVEIAQAATMMLCLRDPSDSLRVQEQLRLLESAVHHTADAVLITTADLDAPGPQIIFVNPAFCAMTGYQPHEVIGQNPRMFQGQATDHAVLAELRQLLRDGQPFHGEIINYRKDGVPYYLEWTTAPLRGRDGAITHFVALQRDITQRKQAQLNLQYRESRFRRMVDRLQNLYDIGQAILSATSLEMIAQRAVRHIVGLIPCSCASIVLLDLETEALRTLASQRQVDPKAAPGDSDSAMAEAASNHVYLNVPIMVAQRMIGTLKLEAQRHEIFTDEHTDIAREVANVLAVAIEHTQLFQQLQASRDRLAALSRRLMDIQEEERRHLARELHDEIGQSLTAIRINLDNLDAAAETPAVRGYLQDITLIVQDVVQQVRTLSADLRPSMLDDLGLISTLRWFLDRQAQRSGLQIQFLPQDRSLAIEAPIATACFRIVQESLTNIVRHANASSVTVALTWDNGQLALQICDDGCGFDPQLVRMPTSSNTGFGLLGMQERAALVGGRCTISAAPGHGADVRALFPLTSYILERRRSTR